MAFNLSSAQISRLIQLRDRPTSADGPRPLSKAYELLAGWGADQPGVERASVLWLKTATLVNRDEGAFSTFIRSYTSYQHQLRYGTALSKPELDGLSDTIARAVLKSVIVNNGLPTVGDIPTLRQIGRDDATGVVQARFHGNVNAWSGVLLMPFLGDSSYLDNLLRTPNASSTYDALAVVASAHKSLGLTGALNLIYATLKQFGVKDAPPASLVTEIAGDIGGFISGAYGTSLDNALFARATFGKFGAGGAPLAETLVPSGALGAEFIHAGGGDDTVRIADLAFEKVVDGGDGRDKVDLSAVAANLNVGSDSEAYSLFRLLVAPSGILGRQTILINVETLILGGGSDVVKINLSAAAPLTRLETGAGKDVVTASGARGLELMLGDEDDTATLGDGNDLVDGGRGNDRLTGGGGSDRFVLGAGGGWDTINDPQAGDRILVGTNVVQGAAVIVGHDLYRLSGHAFVRQGPDLAMTAAGGAESGFVLRGFFPAGHDGTSDSTNMGITIPGRDDPATNPLARQAGSLTAGCPIVLDLNSDGIKYLPYDFFYGRSPRFDIDNDRFAEGLEWLHPSDGFLVRDTNGNGRIDDQTEMFGDDGGTSAFAKLGRYDANGDGKLDSRDTAFSTLRIWQDGDGDAVTDAGELKTLAALNIKSLSVAAAAPSWPDGPEVIAVSSFERTDGSRGRMADVSFDVSQLDSQYVGVAVKLDYSTLFLPLSRGYGSLHSLQNAMSQDAVLKAQVSGFANLKAASQIDEIYDRTNEIILRWTAADGLSRAGTDRANAARLKAVQQFAGTTEDDNVDVAYGAFTQLMLERLLTQGPLKQVFVNAIYDFGKDDIILNQSLDSILAKARANAPTGLAEKTAYWNAIALVAVNAAPQLHLATMPREHSWDSPADIVQAQVSKAAGFRTVVPTIYGTSAAESLTGSGVLFGSAGNDTLNGFSGTSFLINVGDGNDLIKSTGTGGRLLFGPGIGFESLGFTQSSAGLNIVVPGGGSVLIANRGYITSLGFADESVRTLADVQQKLPNAGATAGDDKLFGNAAANVIDGGAGNDAIDGGAGDDMLAGGAGKDVLTGGDGNDTLSGGAGDDRFHEGPGADRIDGGDGADWVDYGNALSGVVIDLTAASQSGAAAGDRLIAIENVRGTEHDDVFHGSPGPQFFEAWSGFDTISYARSGAAVRVKLGYGELQYGGDAEGDRLGNFDKVIGSPFGDVITGMGGTNELHGGGGDDLLDAGWAYVGVGTYAGGSGADTFIVRKSPGSATIVTDFTAVDRILLQAFGTGVRFATLAIRQSGPDTLVDFGGGQTLVLRNVAKSLLGPQSFGEPAPVPSRPTITGTIADDILTGTAVAETLLGLAGRDSLAGAGGADTVDGGAGDDRLSGGPGDDLLVGGPGSDYVDGGDGKDTLSFANSPIWVSSDLALNNHWNGDAAWDNVVGVENIDGSPHGDHLSGDAAANRLAGGGGNDVLTGRAGNDALIGGEGDDRLIGGDGDDQLSGGKGSDFVDGGGGTDTALYADSAAGVNVDLGGNNHWNGDAAWDSLVNVENVVGSAQADNLVGSAIANRLSGGAGDDRLDGRGAGDILDGGTGNDRFVIGAEGGRDVILAFEGEGVAGGDIIELRGVAGLGSFAALQARTVYDPAAATATISTADGFGLVVNGVTQAFVGSDFLFI